MNELNDKAIQKLLLSRELVGEKADVIGHSHNLRKLDFIYLLSPFIPILREKGRMYMRGHDAEEEPFYEYGTNASTLFRIRVMTDGKIWVQIDSNKLKTLISSPLDNCQNHFRFILNPNGGSYSLVRATIAANTGIVFEQDITNFIGVENFNGEATHTGILPISGCDSTTTLYLTKRPERLIGGIKDSHELLYVASQNPRKIESLLGRAPDTILQFAISRRGSPLHDKGNISIKNIMDGKTEFFNDDDSMKSSTLGLSDGYKAMKLGSCI